MPWAHGHAKSRLPRYRCTDDPSDLFPSPFGEPPLMLCDAVCGHFPFRSLDLALFYGQSICNPAYRHTTCLHIPEPQRPSVPLHAPGRLRIIHRPRRLASISSLAPDQHDRLVERLIERKIALAMKGSLASMMQGPLSARANSDWTDSAVRFSSVRLPSKIDSPLFPNGESTAITTASLHSRERPPCFAGTAIHDVVVGAHCPQPQKLGPTSSCHTKPLAILGKQGGRKASGAYTCC